MSTMTRDSTPFMGVVMGAMGSPDAAQRPVWAADLGFVGADDEI